MKAMLTFYEHHAPGFPGVVLKWTEREDWDWSDGYVVVNGIIDRSGPWRWKAKYPRSYAAWEMERFDAWVRQRFADDPSVQG